MKTAAISLFIAVLSCLPVAADDDPLAPARQAVADGDPASALRLFKAEAAAGNGAAASAIGELILAGTFPDLSATDALEWLEKAVAARDPGGHHRLALLLFTAPEGIEQDPERARFLLQQAAEMGFAPSQYQLGLILESEIDLDGPNPDFSPARRWLEEAAEQGLPEALVAMVRYADQGLGGEPDPVAATDYCILAARAGSPAAMNLMGLRYQLGNGIRADNVAAAGWFLRAAQENYAPAHVNLGQCYADGIGLLQDYDKAGENFSAAAKLAHAPGEFLLGQLFEHGLGTEPDPVKAYVLYARAASRGLEDASEPRDRLFAQLSDEDKAIAAKRLNSPK